jgi:hypothetical protein
MLTDRYSLCKAGIVACSDYANPNSSIEKVDEFVSSAVGDQTLNVKAGGKKV